jgi:hypothetical protein
MGTHGYSARDRPGLPVLVAVADHRRARRFGNALGAIRLAEMEPR